MTTNRSLDTARRGLLLLGALAAAGCVSTRGRPTEEIRWPLPPDVARVKFVRAFRSDDDLRASALRRTLRALIEDSRAGSINEPTGIALSVDERTLYVTSSTATPLLAVRIAEGKIVKFGDGDVRPKSAYGVAVDGDDNVYVADSGADLVLVYAPDGRLLRRIGEKLERPTGIAIDRRRQLLYVVSGASRESQHHRVEVYSVAGKHLRTIGTRGGRPGEFNFPTHLAVSKDGMLVVSDMLNFRVQEFDPEGNLVSFFGGPGQAPGSFDKAKGLAFDAFGNIYVVDSQLAIVQIFNSRHQVLMGFGGRLEKLGYMLLPTAIAIDSKNTIYVADFAGRCISEYQLVNTTPEDSFRRPVESPAKGAVRENPQGG